MRRLVQTWALGQQRRIGKMRTLGRRLWREGRITVAFVILVVVPVKSSLADWNWVPTGSMNPTILEGDLIYVNKAAYDLRIPLTLHRLASWSQPQRGDVVVCLSPEDGTRLVKRVVGTPGDTIQMKRNVLFLNGRPLAYNETGRHWPVHLPGQGTAAGVLAWESLDRTDHPVLSIPGLGALRSFGPVTVPEGSYFVLGDNRDVSRDSRYFGLVPREAILGRAGAVLLSFDIMDKYQPRLGRFLTRLR
jgi:signal peptidase I